MCIAQSNFNFGGIMKNSNVSKRERKVSCSQKGKQITRMQIMPLILFAQLLSFVDEGRFTNLVTNSVGHYLANRCIK